jgi:hypothetical protein
VWLGPLLTSILKQFPFVIHAFYSHNGSEFVNDTARYLNLHRPFVQADVEVDAKGKQRRRSKRYQTPLEALLALPKAAQFLRRRVSCAPCKREGG